MPKEEVPKTQNVAIPAEPPFPTEEVMRIVHTSLEHVKNGRFSEPVNERARQLLESLAEPDSRKEE